MSQLVADQHASRGARLIQKLTDHQKTRPIVCPVASEDSNSESEDALPLQNMPVLSSRSDGSDADEAPPGKQPLQVAATTDAKGGVWAHARGDGLQRERGAAQGTEAASSTLPSADDFDGLGDSGFLFVERPVVLDPSWKMTPDEAAAAANKEARTSAAATRAGLVASLPMNKYGRGLNNMQLEVELSARAAGINRVAMKRKTGDPAIESTELQDDGHGWCGGRGGGAKSKKKKWTESYET